MHTSRRFASSFLMLGGISKLALGAMLGLVSSCALDDVSAVDDTAATDDGGDGASADAVCTRGRFRCHAQVRTAPGDRRGMRATAAAPAGYGPSSLQQAYNINPSLTVTAKPL